MFPPWSAVPSLGRWEYKRIRRCTQCTTPARSCVPLYEVPAPQSLADASTCKRESEVGQLILHISKNTKLCKEISSFQLSFLESGIWQFNYSPEINSWHLESLGAAQVSSMRQLLNNFLLNESWNQSEVQQSFRFIWSNLDFLLVSSQMVFPSLKLDIRAYPVLIFNRQCAWSKKNDFC